MQAVPMTIDLASPVGGAAAQPCHPEALEGAIYIRYLFAADRAARRRSVGRPASRVTQKARDATTRGAAGIQWGVAKR
jgi:hypothetical protein